MTRLSIPDTRQCRHQMLDGRNGDAVLVARNLVIRAPVAQHRAQAGVDHTVIARRNDRPLARRIGPTEANATIDRRRAQHHCDRLARVQTDTPTDDTVLESLLPDQPAIFNAQDRRTSSRSWKRRPWWRCHRCWRYRTRARSLSSEEAETARILGHPIGEIHWCRLIVNKGSERAQITLCYRL